jgi:Mg-chelatase subunit ChlD
MAFLAPLFFVGLAALAIPVIVHLIQRERKDVIEFPSLMFIRQIPYQSVERRRIHNWLLLALRAAAMTLLVAAFTRPFFTEDPLQAAAATGGAREVVILLDRSASMGYGDHWARAQTEARQIVQGLSGEDEATLVLFGMGTEETIRATGDKGRLEAAIEEATVSSDGTRFAPALRLAQSLLSRSSKPRKEAVLISDFQRTGWERQEAIHLPEGATLLPVSVASPETSDLAVSSVALQRASFEAQERVTITAGLTNRGENEVKGLPVTLQIDGRTIETRPVTIASNASGSVTFSAVTASGPGMRATINAGTDALPADNVFHFVISPSRPVSVLIVQGEGASQLASYYLTTALSIGTSPPFRAEAVSSARLTPQHFEGRSVVVLNDSTSISTQANDLLRRFVEQGGGLLTILGERSVWSGGETPLLPGTLGGAVDRLRAGSAGTLGFLDYDHPIFDEFKDPRNGNFSNVRFFSYRALAPAPTDRVLARYDDGAAAMVERQVGNGRAIAFTSKLDADWNDFPVKPLFLPLLQETMRYLAQYEEPVAWYTVGRMLDISVPIGALVREGGTGQAVVEGRNPTALVMAPSGGQTTLGEGGVKSLALAEQGFYSIRVQGAGERRPLDVAVNLDPAEADLAALPPQEFAATATGRAAVTTSGQSLENPELTPADMEKKQSIWWYIFLLGVLALLAEAVLANRLSGRGVPQPART